MVGLWSDAKSAARTLARSPLFTLAAVLSLALGIGANTAIFSLLDQLVLRLLPVKAPEQLVMIWSTGPHLGNNNGSRAQSYPMYQEYQKQAKFFSHVFARYLVSSAVSFNGQTERVDAELVSGNYFQAMGVTAAAGRVFTPEEDDRNYKGHPVVVLSHDYWASRFGGKRDVIGQKLMVNNYPMTIVGVSAAGFTGMDPARSPQIRVPIQMKPIMTPGSDRLGDRRSQWIQMFARMKPGETIDTVRPKLQGIFHQQLEYEINLPQMKNISAYLRDLFLKRQVQLEQAASGYSNMRNNFGKALIVLMCMVGLVLLIACANVASLLIARAVARRKEIAVRLAVGASRAQLIRQLLIESVALSLWGAVAGILLAIWTIRGLISFLPVGGTPLMLSVQPDLRVLGFSIGVAVVTGILFGLAPAFQGTKLDQWSTLKDAAGAVAGASGGVNLRKALVAGQVALSFLLLAGAALFVQSLGNLKKTDTGFQDLSNLVTFQVNAPLNGYTVPRMKILYKQLLENVRATAGVRSAGFATVPLLHGWESDSSVKVEGYQAKDGEDIQAFMNTLSPGYFSTMGVKLLDGRDFRDSDVGEKISVAIVNRKFQTYYFGKKSAVGRRFGFGGGPNTKLDIEIVGVTEDTLYEGPRDGVHRQAFVPLLQVPYPTSAVFYVRSRLPSDQMYATLRNEVRKLDASLPVYEVKTLESQLDETLATERLIAALSSAFGLLATALAAVGLYGVMAFVVVRRTKEIGLRMALGAHPMGVIWLVMREVLMLLGIGLAVGLPSAYLLSRYIQSQLYNVQPANLGTAVATVIALAAVALTAGFLPARRASAIHPMTALRYE
jgi:putative ABC transport system permease protein